ncbi:hypothetical protein PM004_15000 [Clostridium paraputrificum]|uniref:hypothetical protein n=1 Tax=Clostridium TaxID=1485 RepID=UPI00232C8908|nr:MULTISPECIES: hypothetical protein [Clostridium]MDB2090654.1 hypothetical protein [Clostridium paraputrificum]MDB2097103.1 hypothetical protein [Clostridium paraputrificum]MDU1180389.1 hypothetical protein [Clostridium sp.]MDU1227646.1 hypothetical protein [Clostridium sp.]MDU4320480.1 hypothetical protein [Clostridium sp.]
MNNFWGLSEDEIKKKFKSISEKKGDRIIREKIYDILISRNLCIEESTLRKNLDDDLQKISDSINILDKNQAKATSIFLYALVAHISGKKEIYLEFLRSNDVSKGLFSNHIINDEERNKKLDNFYGIIGYSKAVMKVHQIMVLGEYNKPIYTVVTRDREAMSKNDIRTFKWDYCSMDEFIYSIMCDYYATKRTGYYFKENDEFLLKMYYSLYLYLTEDENKEEYKKLTLNYSQRSIESKKFAGITDFLMLVDLSITFPEVFGDIIDKPHKIVKADESLLDFNKVKAVTPLSNVEKDLIKNLKDEDIRILMEKPKKLKNKKDFINNLVVLKHNAEIYLSKDKEKLERADDFSQYLSELNTLFYIQYELKNNDKLKEILEDSEKIALQFREFVEKKTSEYDEDEEEIGFLTLGYRLFELALMFSLMEEDGKSKYYFKESSIYLKGEVEEKYFETPRESDGCSNSFLKNTYAHIMNGDVDNFKAALYINPDIDYIEDDEELLEYEVTDPMVLSVYEDTNIKELLKTVKDMLRVDKAYGREVSRQKEICEVLNKIVKLEKSKDKEKAKEAINKKLDKVYNSIASINSYLEVYPMYLGLKSLYS